MVNFIAGDQVEVVYREGTSTTPLWTGEPHLYNGFLGFLLADDV